MKFSSKEAYQKWLAYGKIHQKMDGSGRKRVTIQGKNHSVKHTLLKKHLNQK